MARSAFILKNEGDCFMSRCRNYHCIARSVFWGVMVCILSSTLFAQEPAKEAATVSDASKVAVDEFGVPTGDTPPPIPKGYKTKEEGMVAAMLGQLEILHIDKPIPLPAGVTETLDIEYGKGGDKSLLLNLYAPEKLDKPVPGLIFIHGGGWKSGSRTDYKYYAVRYAKRGYVVASITYRFAQDAPFPAAVQDAKCAVRWMRANAEKYHVDPNRIAAIGGSAGGHLSMMLGYSSDVPELEGNGGWPGVSSKVQAVVDLYGPPDLDCEAARKDSTVQNFIGKPYEEAPKLYEQASPYRYLTPDDPPTLIFQGTIDDIVPPSQSDFLAEKLKAAGIPYQYEKYEGWPHTMDIALPVNIRCQYMMNAFFDKYLKGGDK